MDTQRWEINITVNRTSGAPYNATGVLGDDYDTTPMYFNMDS
jgi:hypothetical protein